MIKENLCHTTVTIANSHSKQCSDNLTQLHHLVDLLDDPVPAPALLRDPPAVAHPLHLPRQLPLRLRHGLPQLTRDQRLHEGQLPHRPEERLLELEI